nr:PREDICTED: uncharacterized protein LOC109044041 [Bemisia tabaci]
MESCVDSPRGSFRSSEKSPERLNRALLREKEFLDFITGLPAMSPESVSNAAQKETEMPISTEAQSGGLEHLEQLHRLMEHLGQLKRQNSKLQKRVLYLESSDRSEDGEQGGQVLSRDKRSIKSKSSYYGNRSVVRSPRERSKSLATPSSRELKAMSSLAKSRVSKWTKVKEAFKWEKTCENLPEAKSEDSGISTGEDSRHLQVPHPHSASDHSHSSVSVSPADSVLSGHFSYDQLTGDFVGNHRAWSSSGEEFEHDLQSGLENKDLKDEQYEQKLAEIANGVQRSKSLDCEHIREVVASLDESLYDKLQETNGGKIEAQQQKIHKTPWGKVKGIIQTRKGSLKKKKNSTTSEEGPVIGDSDEEPVPISTPEITFTENAAKDFSSVSSTPTSKRGKEFEDLPQFRPDQMGGSINKRRLFAPLLTLTLPSTEELRAGIPTVPSTSSKSPSPQSAQFSTPKDAFPFRDDTQSALFDNKEVLPPSRLSKWSKVKNAFLTSTIPSSSSVHVSSSVPSSPSRVSSFIYDLEPDDLEGGDSGEDARKDDVFPEDSRVDVQKTYRQLQMKLSAEFSKKLNEWEQLKSSGPTQNYPITAGRTVANMEELTGSKVSRGKEHWESKSCSQIAQLSQLSHLTQSQAREVAALQQLGEDNLSAEFKKKLEEWEKLKHVTSESPTSCSPSSRQLHFRKKIADWQRWMPGGGSKLEGSGAPHTSSSSSEQLQEDYLRGLDEYRVSSPKLSRKELELLTEKKKRGFGRVRSSDSGSTTPSPSPTAPGTGGRKRDDIRYSYVRTHFPGKSHHQGVKELAWLEKELTKIEREKQRLEREKEKYEERLARLEKMKTAIGIDIKKKEVLVPTSTGLVRFQGISQKFTRKLYEWENARGIRPEASTFALLQPGYRPAIKRNAMNKEGEGNLPRSRSMGSVTDLSSADPVQPGMMTHQPSSLSLNDMDDLSGSELPDDGAMTDSGEDEMPEALIVEVEDVVEETASALSNSPIAVAHTPIYRYTNVPREITSLSYRTFDHENASEDEDSPQKASQFLLERNIDLLGQFESEQGICRKLEDEMENVNEQMNLVLRSKEEQTDSLERASKSIDIPSEESEEHITRLKRSIKELERHHELLRQENENLQTDLSNRNEQQAAIAQDLVGTVKRLQLIHSDRNSQEPNQIKDFASVQALSSQLLQMAERLQTVMGSKLEGNDLETASNEMIQLPFQLTKKVMELKQALNAYESFTDKSALSASTADEVPSVTVKFLRRKKSDTTQEAGSGESFTWTAGLDSPVTEAVISLPRPRLEDHDAGAADDETDRPPSRDQDDAEAKASTKAPASRKKLMRTKSFKRKPSQGKEDAVGTGVESSRSCEEIGASRSKSETSTRLKRERRVVKSRREMDLSKLCRDDESVKVPASSPPSWSRKNTDTSTADNNNNNDTFVGQFDPSMLDDSCVEGSNCNSMASVFVPTKRKIFSPLVKDSNGNTESVISYEIRENPPQDTADDKSRSEVIPPCWSLHEAKSQPASPAFQRKASPDRSEPRKYDPSQTRTERRFSEQDSVRNENLSGGNRDIGFPPMSPISSRRELKNSKEAAPSIRMMIAKYNLKVSGSGVKNDTKSGTISPGWRSPIAERRVLTQVEGYQEGIGRLARHNNPFEMKKSASAGAIEFKDDFSEEATSKQRKKPEEERKDISVPKSSSEGAMRQYLINFEAESQGETPREKPQRTVSQSENESPVPAIKLTLSHSKTVGMMPSSRHHELHRSSSRAMKLQKAKEEFLSRGAIASAESQATSECGTSSNTPSLSVSSECDLVRDDYHHRRDAASRQSYGSESSCGDDSSLVTLGDDHRSLGIDRSALIKSASAGMLTSDFNEADAQKDSSSTASSAKQSKSAFSSIASKFRKVKMRRHKEPELGQLDTVSALCRQSLAVNVQPPPQPTNSKSCPSSPVLQRPAKSGSNYSSPQGSWIPIPGKKKSKSRIF